MNVPKFARRRIGIVGAGIASLHLGLRLRQLGIDCTIITDRTPDQVAAGPLANAVVHWSATLRRERVLQACHWPAETFGFDQVRNVIAASEPVEIRCDELAPARAVDDRIYLPRLMEDFMDRGGRLQVTGLDVKDIGAIAERFDLVVVATPGNGFSRLFARDVANSPCEAPQRHWMAGLFTGLRPTTARRATASVAPGHGEAMLFPLLSRTGMVHALTISAPQADELEMLQILSRGPAMVGFRAALLRRLEQLHPAIYDRIDTTRFDLQDRNDLALVGITPVVRHPHTPLGGGKYAIALGDVHVTMDPLLGQGANVGSYSAFALADAIVEADAFDLAFCRAVERGRAARVLAASRWTNAFLQPPDAARIELMAAMSQDRQLAGQYFENFNQPEWQWERVGSAARIRSWLREQRSGVARPSAHALAPSAG